MASRVTESITSSTSLPWSRKYSAAASATICGADAKRRGTVGGRRDHHRTFHAFRAEFLIQKRLDLAVAFADQRDHADLRRILSRHGAQQRAFTDAAAAEQSDSLALAARQKTIDRTDAGDQALGDMFPRERVRGRGIQRIRLHRLHRRAAVHGLSESVQHAAEQAGSNRQPRIRYARDHAAAELQAFGFFQGHGEHAPVAKSDHLRADAVPFGGEHFAEIANGHGGTLRFDQQSHGGGDLSAPRQQIELLQILQVRLQDVLIGNFRAHKTHRPILSAKPRSIS